jgi:hypothetical protein
MPLPGISHEMNKIFLFVFILTILTNANTFSQDKKFAAQEDKLATLYSKMASFYNEDLDSLELYSKKFEKDFKRFIKSNPGTMKYDFKKLSKDDNICLIQTSSDGNFRIYSWDTENPGPVHYYKSIYQWKGNGRVFTNITDDGKDVDGGDVYQLKGRYFEYIGTTHTLLEDIKAKFQTEVTHQCDTNKTHLNDKLANGRISFLNKDFSTTLFSKNSSVAYWYCNAYDNDNKRTHFEMVSIIFKTDKERDAALERINSTERDNFKLKLLTRFKVKTFENGLLIVYTEINGNKVLEPFWDQL